MTEGPRVTTRRSCGDCDHVVNVSYAVQGDSGFDVYCGKANKRHIGDTTWETPAWCPFLGGSDAL